MIRVLMTADAVGGVWSYACELIAALAALDAQVEVTLATMGAPLSQRQARQTAVLPNLDVVESRFALEWMPDPWRDVDAAGAWLLELAARVAPDIVHINGYCHAALPFEPPVVVAAHACVWTWMRAVHHRDPGPAWAEYRRRALAGLAAAEIVVGATEATVRSVLDAYGATANHRVIPNACATAPWRPGDKTTFVLSAGRLWDGAKGIAELATCAHRVEWPIVVAGPAAPPGTTAATLPRGVHVLGEVAPDELAAWMARASIFALPARYEPFGLSILQAALSGCALVIGDIPALREVWRDIAIYVPPGDPDALGFALNALIREPLVRNTLGARARTRALELSPARMSNAYHGLYDEVIARRRAWQESAS